MKKADMEHLHEVCAEIDTWTKYFEKVPTHQGNILQVFEMKQLQVCKDILKTITTRN